MMWRLDSLEKTLLLGKTEAGGAGNNRGWDGWMASLTRRTWVWASSHTWWWTGSPGMLQSMGSQRVGHWTVEQEQLNNNSKGNESREVKELAHGHTSSRVGSGFEPGRVIYIQWTVSNMLHFSHGLNCHMQHPGTKTILTIAKQPPNLRIYITKSHFSQTSWSCWEISPSWSCRLSTSSLSVRISFSISWSLRSTRSETLT